jgi:hypothetical protein
MNRTTVAMSKTSEYKESMYQKGYEMIIKGMELQAQAKQSFIKTGNYDARVVENAAECYRKGGILVGASRMAAEPRRGRELECDVVRSDGLTDDQYVRLNRGRK